jgi:hypothetical protein
MLKEVKEALTVPTSGFRLVRVNRPALKPIDISDSGNACNKTSFRSSTLRNALDSKTIGQSESRRIRLG